MAYRNKEQGASVPTSVPGYLGELGTRIGVAADSLGGRKLAAAAMKVSTDQLARYMRGENEPPVGAVTGLARASGYCVEWIATGEGPMLVAEATKGQEIKPGRQLRDMPADYAAIPLYEVQASGGGGAVVEGERVVDFLHFKQEWIRTELNASPSDLYLVNVDGQSMEPTLRPGDVILVDHRDQHQARDGVYVLRLDGALLVKRLQKLPGGVIKVSSDNPAYEPFTLKLSEIEGNDFAIIGRVVWAGRRM